MRLPFHRCTLVLGLLVVMALPTSAQEPVVLEPGIGEIVVAMYGGGACEDPEDACRYRIRVDVPAPPPPAIRLECGADVEGVLDSNVALTNGLEGFSPGGSTSSSGAPGTTSGSPWSPRTSTPS